MEYLEERYPEPPLLPADPAERALARLAIFRFDDRLGDDYYALRRGERARRAARGAARRARRRARGAAVPHRPRVRARGHRVPAVGAAGPRAPRRLARAVPGARGVARAAAASGRRSRPSSSSPACDDVVVLPPRAAARRADVGAVDGVAPRLYGRGEHDGRVGAVGARRGRRRARPRRRLDGRLLRARDGAARAGAGARARARRLARRGRHARAARGPRGDDRDDPLASGAAGLWETMGPKLFPDGADEAVVERRGRSRSSSSRTTSSRRSRRSATAPTRPTSGTRSRLPTLIAVGDRDPFVSERTTLARPAARDGELHVFEGCGHLPSLERPDEFERVLEGFLGRV